MLAYAATLACGGDAVLTLGVGDPAPSFGDHGRRVRNLNEAASNEREATLTEDLLEVFFASDRAGGFDIWQATRASRTDAFEPPLLLAEASSPFADESPAISRDGLTLWVASDREGGQGGLDIWRLRRPDRGAAWGAIENATALNGPAADRPRPPGLRGSIMPIASTRGGGDLYQTYLAIGSGAELDVVTIEPLADLWEADASMESPCLTDDGLLLFFARAVPGTPSDLYLAWRTSTDEAFRDPIALTTLDSAGDERDPFLSADQFRFFFSSSRRDGVHFDIYATKVDVPLRQ